MVVIISGSSPKPCNMAVPSWCVMTVVSTAAGSIFFGIDDIVISPADNLVHFQNSFALAVSIPAYSHTGKFVVLAEPIRDGKYGKAFVEGICPVQVNMNAEIDTEADILNWRSDAAG